MLIHAPWAGVPGLRHGFLDRDECAADRWDAVLARIGTRLPIVVPRQVHGTRVARAVAGETPEADALVIGDGGLLVGVVTADCVPVLLVDRARHAAAAVHAGWRGMSAGVLEAGVDHLVRLFGSEPNGIEAAIGPAVGGCCYEVGTEVRSAFEARRGAATGDAWTSRAGRDHVDLRVAARLLLAAAGVAAAEILGPCTACDTGYHSYRRDGGRTGRQLSFVGWA